MLVCEIVTLGNEAHQMFRQRGQYFNVLDGGFFNVLDVAGSVLLCVGAIAHFSDELSIVKTCGSIGIFIKWIGREPSFHTAPYCMILCMVLMCL